MRDILSVNKYNNDDCISASAKGRILSTHAQHAYCELGYAGTNAHFEMSLWII